MLPEIQKLADNGDIRGLRYIFDDCLDVDPTFEKYKDGWELCKNLEGFLDEHKELSAFENNPSCWNEDYWIKLKMELMDNFSEKRFEHMKEVSKVYYAEKIKRLESERKIKEGANIAATKPTAISSAPDALVHPEAPARQMTQNVILPSDEERTAQRRIEEEKAERYRREQKERDAQFEAEQKRRQAERDKKNKEEERKKLMGAAVIAIAAIAIAAAVILIIIK